SATIGTGLTITTGGLTVSAGASSFAGNVSISGSNTFGVGTGTASFGGNISQTAGNFDASTSGGSFKTSTGLVTLGGATTASSTLTSTGLLTASNALTLTSGNFDASTSGGTFKTSTGAVSLNGVTTVTGTNAFNVSGGLTTLGAGVTVTGLGTFNTGVTIATGSTFTNASSTLFSSVAIANHTSNSTIGAHGTTVDVATTFDVTQTTGGITLTLDTPAVATSGRVVYINSLSGNSTFTMYGVSITAGSSVGFIWNGTAWVATSTGSTGVNTIGTVGSPSANGATITGSTLNLDVADGSNPGLISTAAQTIAGAKTFNADAIFSGAGTGLSVSQAATVGNGLTVTAGGETITAGDLALTGGNLTTNGTQRLSNAGALSNITGYIQSSGNFDA